MINIRDIYFFMNNYLLQNSWYLKKIEEQKKLINDGLCTYLIKKITEINPTLLDDETIYDVPNLFKTLASLIPEEKYFDTIRFFTHYLISVISSLQNWEMTWFCNKEKTEGIKIEINSQNKWNNLITSEDEDFQNTFLKLWEYFNKYFGEDYNKKLILKK